jgi:hypothetical protein
MMKSAAADFITLDILQNSVIVILSLGVAH